MNILHKITLAVALIAGFCMAAMAQTTFTYQNLEYEVISEPSGSQK